MGKNQHPPVQVAENINEVDVMIPSAAGRFQVLVCFSCLFLSLKLGKIS